MFYFLFLKNIYFVLVQFLLLDASSGVYLVARAGQQ